MRRTPLARPRRPRAGPARARRSRRRSPVERPAVLGRLDDRAGQRAEHRRPTATRPGQVEPRDAGVAGLGHQDVGRDGGRPAATGTSAQKTLPQEKCSSSTPPVTGPAATPTPDDGAPDAERRGPLPPLAEGVADDRQRGREDQRRERAHREPGRDQRPGVESTSARRRRWRRRSRAGRRSAPAAGRTGPRGCRRRAPAPAKARL